MITKFTKLTSIVTTTILLTACASSTQINSTPPNANIFIDGQKMGITPYKYTDTKITGSVTNIKLKKPGYEDLNVILTRSEQADPGAIVGGIFSLVPFLWTMKYNPEHNYELVSLPPEPVAPESSPMNLEQTAPIKSTTHKKSHKKKKK